MRIVITGATGNVGSAVLRRLAADDTHDVVGVARRLPEPQAPFDTAQWHSLDLSLPESAEGLHEALSGADAVVHLAWGFQPSHDVDYLEALGVGGTRRVLDAVDRAGVPHVVHMSSVGAYSPKRDDAPVDESWPTGGVPSSPYSRHKAAAERLLDEHERRHPDRIVTRLRPGIIGQGAAGSALLRYGLPAAVPAWLVGHVPVLPLDRRLAIPMVHADDVADAVLRVLGRRVGGAFNLATEPAIVAASVAGVLGARLVHVPSAAMRVAMSAAWHARLQPVDPGWLDLGFAVPLLDTTRARRELGWAPTSDALSVLAETVEGMIGTEHAASPVLRLRTVPRQLARAVRRGPVSSRERP
jgi:nucleoside-diphosphate-sugar epimerase